MIGCGRAIENFWIDIIIADELFKSLRQLALMIVRVQHQALPDHAHIHLTLHPIDFVVRIIQSNKEEQQANDPWANDDCGPREYLVCSLLILCVPQPKDPSNNRGDRGSQKNNAARHHIARCHEQPHHKSDREDECEDGDPVRLLALW
ncbi:MAG TPA: hypothetical protein VGP99_03975 [Tepidisphaeraceae bacterium]|nr:hypothetical protein [Tepidisphaeraceae bacterium]